MNRLLAVLALLLLQGCSLPKMAADTMVPVLQATRDEVNRSTIARHAREAGPALIFTMDGLVSQSPENAELRLLQAEMNATFAFAFLEKEDPAWATALYRRARAAALVALADEDEELAAALDSKGTSTETVAPLLQEADEDCLPALFWWAFARGAEVNLNRGEASQVGALPRVDLVMGWCLERDPDFFNAGPHLYFAMRNLALPPSFGGKPEKGLLHFQEVDKRTGGKLLMATVLRAQFHAPTLAATPAGAKLDAVLAAQKAAWDAYYGALKKVVEAPSDLWPEQALSNAVAKERALALLRDPGANNIIMPKDAKNEFAPAADEGGAWGDDGGAWGGGEQGQ